MFQGIIVLTVMIADTMEVLHQCTVLVLTKANPRTYQIIPLPLDIFVIDVAKKAIGFRSVLPMMTLHMMVDLV